MPTLVVLDHGEPISISFDDLLKYPRQGFDRRRRSRAFKAMERAFPLLSPAQPPARYDITVQSAFPGGGAHDAFEMVTRAVTGDRYEVAPDAGPEVPEAPGGRFFFRLSYRGTVVDLALRQGLVPEEFLQVACREAPTPAEADRAQELKEEMADRLLKLPSGEVYDAEITSRPAA